MPLCSASRPPTRGKACIAVTRELALLIELWAAAAPRPRAPAATPSTTRYCVKTAPSGAEGKVASSLAEGASGPGFEFWGIAGGFAVLVLLALVRLLSELPTGGTRKETRMNAKQMMSSNSKSIGRARSFWQYLLETVWAAGAGAIGSPLATLSQRKESLLPGRLSELR